MPAAQSVERVKIAGGAGVEKILGLLPVLFEGRTSGQFGHTKLLSDPQKRVRLRSPHR
jgi:hypothetical protein